MDAINLDIGPLAEPSKRVARRLSIIAENRLELLLLEVQEERERFFGIMLLALGVGALGLLAGMTLTAFVAVVFWAYSPVAVLLFLTALYAGTGFWLYRRLTGLRGGPMLSASLDQLRKDRACLESSLT